MHGAQKYGLSGMILSIWISAIIIQVVITILLAIQFARYREEGHERKSSFSVIVAAHNEHSNLESLIPALLKQTYDDYEVIVALDRCTDQSAEFLKSQNQEKIRIVEVLETPDGWDHKKYALTRAVEVSGAEWIAFTDADCLPVSNNWLNHLNNRIGQGIKIILGFSPYQTTGSFLHSLIQYDGFITAFNYLSHSIIGKPYMGVGRNLAINRHFFSEKGGYDSFKSTIGGDDDLFIQSFSTSENTQILLGKESFVASKPKNTWLAYLIQKTRHLSVGSKYVSSDQLFHFIFHSTLLLVWVLLPLISLEKMIPIILFYLFVKWIGYRFAHSKMGAGFNYIWLPLVDFMYAIFIPIVALRSKLVKDIRWKN